ncbi:MAG: hypothetical protein AAGL98_07795 [Planctomycetota bacterium]
MNPIRPTNVEASTRSELCALSDDYPRHLGGYLDLLSRHFGDQAWRRDEIEAWPAGVRRGVRLALRGGVVVGAATFLPVDAASYRALRAGRDDRMIEVVDRSRHWYWSGLTYQTARPGTGPVALAARGLLYAAELPHDGPTALSDRTVIAQVRNERAASICLGLGFRAISPDRDGQSVIYEWRGFKDTTQATRVRRYAARYRDV